MPIVALRTPTPTSSTSSSQGLDVDELLSIFTRDCGDRPPDAVLALNWLEERYRQIWETYSWPFTKKEAMISTVAVIDTDSVTVTTGSTTVTETTSDSKWTSAVVGRKFRRSPDATYYTISAYANTNPDTLTLNRSYEGTTGTLCGYEIFQNILSVGDDVGQILSITSLPDKRQLRKCSQEDLDRAYPHRASAGSPTLWAPAGRDSNDIYQVEFYPYPEDRESYLYRYTEEGPYITGGAGKLVPQIFSKVLRHGWKADYWRWRSAFEGSQGYEYALAGQEEMLFDAEVRRMVARETQNDPPKKFSMAPAYVAHRYRRGAGKWANPRHDSSEMP